MKENNLAVELKTNIEGKDTNELQSETEDKDG